MQENLFTIHITEKGVNFLRRLQAIAPSLFVIAVAVSLAGLVHSIGWLGGIFKLTSANSRYTFFAYTIIAYSFLEVILIPLEVYFFWKFSRKTKWALASGDTEGFNFSFRWLILATTTFLLSLLVNLIYLLVTLYAQFVQKIL